jgi:hypothetical protein
VPNLSAPEAARCRLKKPRGLGRCPTITNRGGRLITPGHSKGCRFEKNDATDVDGDRTRCRPSTRHRHDIDVFRRQSRGDLAARACRRWC